MKIKKTPFLIIFNCLILCNINNLAYAEEFQTELPNSSVNQSQSTLDHVDTPKAHEKNQTYEIGTNIYYFDYKENIPNNPAFKSEERGVIPGLALSYSFLSKKTRFFIDLGSAYQASDILYDGSLQNGTPFTGTSGLKIFQLQGTLGYNFVNSHRNEVGFYAGLASRTWHRVLDKNNETSAGGFDEIYSSFTAPVGLRWNLLLTEKFHVGLDASLGIPLTTYFQVTFPEGFGGQRKAVTLSNSLKTNTSWKLQAPMKYWFNHSFGISVIPFYEVISFESSKIGTLYTTTGEYAVYEISEPSSRTYQYGSQLKIALKL